MQTHNVKLNDVAKEAGKAARMDPKGAHLLNGSGALCLLLQLLPDKHAKQHCVVVANAQLSGEEGQPDVQALEAALLLKELQVSRGSSSAGSLQFQRLLGVDMSSVFAVATIINSCSVVCFLPVRPHPVLQSQVGASTGICSE